ncbi:hypothetical protein HY230_08135 [Candidatus Acetothermia bacterium]|nr:hypothetical protein [Candidatus Acetothermia bacterium]
MPVTKEPKMMRVNFTAPEELIDQIDQFAREHLEDRSTAIRQLIHEGPKSLWTDRVLLQYRRGMTLRETAARVGLDVNTLIELLMQRGIPVSGEIFADAPNPGSLKQAAKEFVKSRPRQK